MNVDEQGSVPEVPRPEADGDKQGKQTTDAEVEAGADPTFETVDDPRIPPGKHFFKIGEVAKLIGLKPYVLRYWETEFSWLRPAKTSSRQRLYRRQDIALLLTIQRLRYEEHHTIASAKEWIRAARSQRGQGNASGVPKPSRPASPAVAATPAVAVMPRPTPLQAVPSRASTGDDKIRIDEIARRLADMRRQVVDLLDAVKE